MTSLFTRVFKRFLVLLLGGIVVFVVVENIFPFLDNRTPLAFALFATYLVTAYLLIPSAFRIFRLLYHPVHLPLYCITPDGFASDPVNIALVGSRQQVILSMELAGWKLADPKTPLSVLHQVTYALLKRPYPSAPISSLYLFGRRQDLAFQKEIRGGIGQRHHVRFWAADIALAEEFESHVRFWHRFHLPSRDHPHASLWVGAASKDVGIALIRHNAQVTHMIDPDTATERKLIVKDLRKAGRLAGRRTIPVYRPLSLRNRAWRGSLSSDGYVSICELR